jgi:hypothetical protein
MYPRELLTQSDGTYNIMPAPVETMRAPNGVETSAQRGDALLNAKWARLEQERRLEQVRHRINFLQAEEARVNQKTAMARQRTREREDLASRTIAMKSIERETRDWENDELELRRQAVAEQRKLSRQAIEKRRLALLEQRHADFVAKKQEAAQARLTILSARSAKQKQKLGVVDAVRTMQQIGKGRMQHLRSEKGEAQQAQAALERAREDAHVSECISQLEGLATEESRLLQAVMRQHATHRAEYDSLVTRLPEYGGILRENRSAAPFSLPQPLARGSPMLDRRPQTAASILRANSRPSSATSPRRSRAGAFGNSAPPSPVSSSLAPHPPSFSTPRQPSRGSRPASRPASAATRASSAATHPDYASSSSFFSATPVAQGGTCMMSAPIASSSGASPRAMSPQLILRGGSP